MYLYIDLYKLFLKIYGFIEFKSLYNKDILFQNKNNLKQQLMYFSKHQNIT